MPKQLLTLLDIHAVNDTVGPMIEENLHVAPAFARTPVARQAGLSYRQPVRVTLPSGEFTNPGQGALVTASTYDFIEHTCHHMEAQLEVYESIVKARVANEGGSAADILAAEASGYMRSEMIDLDKQFFKGKLSGVRGAAKGFTGLQQLVANEMTFGAGGTGSDLASAYFVFEQVDEGVAFILPNGEEFSLSEWNYQQLLISGDAKSGNLTKTNGWTAGLTGYIGLKATKPERCIARVCNISYTKKLNDQIGALVVDMFKVGYKPTVCYMPRLARTGLQISRSATNVTNNEGGKSQTGGRDIVAPPPTFIADVPVVITDSLAFDEAEVTGANTRTTNFGITV